MTSEKTHAPIQGCLFFSIANFCIMAPLSRRELRPVPFVQRALEGDAGPFLNLLIRDQFTPMTRSRSHLKDTQADSSLWYDWWDL